MKITRKHLTYKTNKKVMRASNELYIYKCIKCSRCSLLCSHSTYTGRFLFFFLPLNKLIIYFGFLCFIPFVGAFLRYVFLIHFDWQRSYAPYTWFTTWKKSHWLKCIDRATRNWGCEEQRERERGVCQQVYFRSQPFRPNTINNNFLYNGNTVRIR